MSKTDILRKLKLYKKNPDLVKEVSPQELAELVLVVMGAVQAIDESIKVGRLDGYTPQPDKDYLSLETAQKALNEKVREMLVKTDETLSQTSQALQARVAEAIQNLRDGKDGIVSDAEIQRAAEMALGMLELPDFDALVTEAITTNSEAIRDSLELLVGENRYKVEITDVEGLRQAIDDLALIRAANGGGLGKRQVFDFIREAIANGIITSGGVSAAEDVTFTPAGSIAATDVQAALEELDADIQGLAAGAGISRSIVVTSGNVTAGSVAATDYVYKVAGAHTVTLPTAVSNTNQYDIVNLHTANISLATTSSQTIHGTAAPITLVPNQSLTLQSDGANWIIK